LTRKFAKYRFLDYFIKKIAVWVFLFKVLHHLTTKPLYKPQAVISREQCCCKPPLSRPEDSPTAPGLDRMTFSVLRLRPYHCYPLFGDEPNLTILPNLQKK